MTSRFSAVIFDLDGTLVDSEGLANLTMAEHLNRLGVPLNAAEIEAWLKGRSLPDCYAMVEARFGVTVTEAVDAAMQADFFERLRRDLQPMPGIAAALARIPLPVAVASSSEPEKIELELALTGLTDFFGRHAYSGRNEARPKPAPDGYLRAARELGVAPADCAVVEDSAPGIAAGLAAGMTVFGYRAGDVPGVAHYSNHADLPGLLGL